MFLFLFYFCIKQIIMAYIEKYEHIEDGIITYVDTYFDSSNILKSTYFTQKNKLYVHFSKGGTYSYENVTSEQHNALLEAESSGKYFISEIQKNVERHPYRKEFTLNPSEITEIKLLIETKKKQLINLNN